MRPPDVAYARSGDVAIAYQVVGSGSPDVVFIRGFTGDLLSTWDQPLLVRHVEGLTSNGRLLMLDRRGSDGGRFRLHRESPREPEPERVLSTVLFTDIVGSTELAARLGDANWREVLERHHRLVRQTLTRYSGQEIDTAGDGFFASFDGPGRAVRAALAIVEELATLDIGVRAGLHTGEFEVADGKLAGIGVSIGARIAGMADAGEVLVSSTVKDLVVGSGIRFEARGAHQLKGVPDAWTLYAAESPDADLDSGPAAEPRMLRDSR